MNDNEKQKLLEQDLYKLFDLEENVSLEQIKKAYRKKALELHPDKNLDNKEAAEKRFVELGKAFEILSDQAAKAAYDAVRRNRKMRQERLEKLDDKRKKFKEDLETRENEAKSRVASYNAKSDEERLKREIDRLRREGSKLLEEEMNLINAQVSKSNAKTTEKQKTAARFKVSWKKNTTTPSSFADTELLAHLFSKYGELEIIVLNSKKTSAIVEFKHHRDVAKVLQDERNLAAKYSISISQLGEQAPEVITLDDDSPQQSTNYGAHSSFDDMEAAILRKLQQKS